MYSLSSFDIYEIQDMMTKNPLFSAEFLFNEDTIHAIMNKLKKISTEQQRQFMDIYLKIFKQLKYLFNCPEYSIQNKKNTFQYIETAFLNLNYPQLTEIYREIVNVREEYKHCIFDYIINDVNEDFDENAVQFITKATEENITLSSSIYNMISFVVGMVGSGICSLYDWSILFLLKYYLGTVYSEGDYEYYSKIIYRFIGIYCSSTKIKKKWQAVAFEVSKELIEQSKKKTYNVQKKYVYPSVSTDTIKKNTSYANNTFKPIYTPNEGDDTKESKRLSRALYIPYINKTPFVSVLQSIRNQSIQMMSETLHTNKRDSSLLIDAGILGFFSKFNAREARNTLNQLSRITLRSMYKNETTKSLIEKSGIGNPRGRPSSIQWNRLLSSSRYTQAFIIYWGLHRNDIVEFMEEHMVDESNFKKLYSTIEFK